MFNTALACMLALSLSTTPIVPTTATNTTNLEPAQAQSLVEARNSAKDLEWRVFDTNVGGQPKSVVLLGEVHLGKPEDIASAKTVIDQFQNLATENGSTNDDPEYDYWTMPLAATMATPLIVFLLTQTDAEYDSPMKHARTGARARPVRSVEQLHTPTWVEEIGLLTMSGYALIPFIVGGSFLLFAGRVVFRWRVRDPLRRLGKTLLYTGLFLGSAMAFDAAADDPMLAGRDQSMSKYIDQWIKDPKAQDGPLLVIVGKAHLKGIARHLTNEFGFTERSIDDLSTVGPVKRGLPVEHPL